MSPGLRVRCIKLVVITASGKFGFRQVFDDGLVVLRASNASGKSTCIKSLIYALGLERMLGPNNTVPLTAAMTQMLTHDGQEFLVTESSVTVELENRTGESLTVSRPIAGGKADTRVVTTWDGPALTAGSSTYRQDSFFVRDPGTATREKGFHTRLSSFIGWELPEVQKYDGQRCPLYLETIFPLMLVEQTHGWRGLQMNTPTVFGIRDVKQSALEFLLKLDVAASRRIRQELLAEQSKVEKEWDSIVQVIKREANNVGAALIGLPMAPTGDWPPLQQPHLAFESGEHWVPLHERILAIEKRIQDSLVQVNRPIEAESTALEQTKKEIEKLQFALRNEETARRRYAFELNSLNESIDELERELKRNLDIKKLRKYGAQEGLAVTDSRCPSCNRKLDDTLLSPTSDSDDATLMSIEENIEFIRAKLKTFKAMTDQANARIGTATNRAARINSKLDDLRERARAIERTMVTDERVPSEAVILGRVRDETRLKQIRVADDILNQNLDSLAHLGKRWTGVQAKLKGLKEGELSNDKRKLKKLQRLFITQLKEYGYSSFDPERIELDPNSFRPVREGFDLTFEISASDSIRLIWAYLMSLLELDEDTNHLGLLIFDEPRQQDAAEESYSKLLQRASRHTDEQIILATSHQLDGVERLLSGKEYQLVNVAGKLLKPMD